MSVELSVDGWVEDAGPSERDRPTLSGDLPTVLAAAPMFRRAVVGYDRFQVDTYVRWAEDELATSEREREHLLARHLRTRAELEESRELLAHTSEAGEFLRVSSRVGSMLAAAADEAGAMRAEAEALRAEADADRTAATAEVERLAAEGRRVVADAEAAAVRTVEAAAREADALRAEAGRILEDAGQAGDRIRAEAQAHLAEACAIEQRAAEQADRIREQAADEVAAARLRARDEIVRMLGTGREERRRADAEAATSRERLDRDAADRRAGLLAEIDALEHRRAALLAELDRAAALSAPAPPRPGALAWVREHVVALRTLPHRSVPGRS